MFSDRRDDGPNISEDLRALEGAESSRDLHAQLHHAQVPFGLIVGEGNCEVRKETLGRHHGSRASGPEGLWPGRLAFRPRAPGHLGQWVLSLMEGEALGEDRHVFGEDALINRRGEFGLASP